MRAIRGAEHPSDDERTVEAPPEEPTLSATVDVQAAFAAVDATMPGALVGLGVIEEPAERQEHTLPLVSAAAVLQVRAEAQASVPPSAQASPQAPARVQTQPHAQPQPPTQLLDVQPAPGPAAPLHAQVPAPARRAPAPLVVAQDAEEPIGIPGVGGAQRRRMLRIVIGVLSLCGLLCVGALVRQLWPEPSARTATATPPQPPTATATALPSAVAAPEPPPPSPSSTPTPVAVAAPSSTPTPVAVAAPAGTPTPVAVAAPAVAAPARRPDRRSPAARPAPVAKPAGRAAIVRDAPF